MQSVQSFFRTAENMQCNGQATSPHSEKKVEIWVEEIKVAVGHQTLHFGALCSKMREYKFVADKSLWGLILAIIAGPNYNCLEDLRMISWLDVPYWSAYLSLLISGAAL